jgi:hypothetical protein
MRVRRIAGQLVPQPPTEATIYRVDQRHNLALLKLNGVSAGSETIPYLQVAATAKEGERCFIVGAEENSVWSINECKVLRQIELPIGRASIAGPTPYPGLFQQEGKVIVSNASIPLSDGGAPLINERGQLAGITWRGGVDSDDRRTGWHVASQTIAAFVASFPSVPDEIPFDVSTAGLPLTLLAEPTLLDSNGDGKTDALVYRYLSERDGQISLAAVTTFIDLTRSVPADEAAIEFKIPHGVWGMEDHGKFRFDCFVTSRADGVTAVGYVGPQGIVEEIRLASHSDNAQLVWKLEDRGRWVVSRPALAVPLLETSRFPNAAKSRIEAVVARRFKG